MDLKAQNHTCINTLIDRLNDLKLLSSEDNPAKRNSEPEFFCTVCNERFRETKNSAQKAEFKFKAEHPLKKDLIFNRERNGHRSRKKTVIKVEAHLDEESISIINAFPADIKSNIKRDQIEHADDNHVSIKDVPVKKEIIEENLDLKSEFKSNFTTDLKLNDNSCTNSKPLFTKCVCLTAEKFEKLTIIERGKVNSHTNENLTPSSLVLHKTHSVSRLCGGKLINNQVQSCQKSLTSNKKWHIPETATFLSMIQQDYSIKIPSTRCVRNFAFDDTINEIVESPTSDESGYDSPTFDIASSPSTSLWEDFVEDSHCSKKETIYSYLKCPEKKGSQFLTDVVMSKEEINERLEDITELIGNTDSNRDDCFAANTTDCLALSQQTKSNSHEHAEVNVIPTQTNSICLQVFSPISLIFNVLPVAMQTNTKAPAPITKPYRKIRPKPLMLLRDKIDIKERDNCYERIYSSIELERGCIYVVDESTNSTNLHLATKGSRSDILELVYCLVNVHLQYKKDDAICDINMQDCNGKTAKDYALETGKTLIAKFLNGYSS